MIVVLFYLVNDILIALLCFAERFESMKASGVYYTLVIEDCSANNGNGKVVGTGTLEIEEKFIHSCALVSWIMNNPFIAFFFSIHQINFALFNQVL